MQSLLDMERWLMEAFRASGMIWLLRQLNRSSACQTELIDAGLVLGVSAAAVRHAIEVADRKGFVVVGFSRDASNRHEIALTARARLLLETPVSEWGTDKFLKNLAVEGISQETNSERTNLHDSIEQ